MIAQQGQESPVLVMADMVRALDRVPMHLLVEDARSTARAYGELNPMGYYNRKTDLPSTYGPVGATCPPCRHKPRRLEMVTQLDRTYCRLLRAGARMVNRALDSPPGAPVMFGYTHASHADPGHRQAVRRLRQAGVMIRWSGRQGAYGAFVRSHARPVPGALLCPAQAAKAADARPVTCRQCTACYTDPDVGIQFDETHKGVCYALIGNVGHVQRRASADPVIRARTDTVAGYVARKLYGEPARILTSGDLFSPA